MFFPWILASTLAHAACPPGAVCVDAAVIKAHIGATRMSLDAGPEPVRVGYGIDLGYGTSILTKAFAREKPGLSIVDDVWLDMLLGLRSSAPLSYFGDPEGVFAVGMDTAYVAAFGWQGAVVGLYGGSGIRFNTVFLGGSNNLDGSKVFAPLHLRADLRTGSLRWKAFAWTNTRFTRPGVRFDVPLAETAWISGTWLRMDGPVHVASDDAFEESGLGGSILTLGLRVAAMD